MNAKRIETVEQHEISGVRTLLHMRTNNSHTWKIGDETLKLEL